MQKIENRMQVNKLKINYNKTNYMKITKKKIDKCLFNIKIGENKIQQQDNIKYLAVRIDNGMNWSKHIMYIMQNLVKGLGHYPNLKNM